MKGSLRIDSLKQVATFRRAVGYFRRDTQWLGVAEFQVVGQFTPAGPDRLEYNCVPDEKVEEALGRQMHELV